MRIRWCTVVVALASLSGCRTTASPAPTGPRPPSRTTAVAGPVTAPAPPTAPVESRPRVNLVAEDAPLEDVLVAMGQLVGWNLVLDPVALDERVDLRLRGIGWREALRFLAERRGFRVVSVGERTLFITQSSRARADRADRRLRPDQG